MTLAELQEKRGKLMTQAREALDEVGKNTDEARTAELEKRHDDIMAEFDKVEKHIEREQRLAAAERAEEERTAAERKAKRPIAGNGGEARGAEEGEKPEYREVFHKFLAEGADLAALEPEERKILRTGAAPKEAEKRIQTVGTTTAGGYTVPVELANFIVKSMKAWGPMYDEDVCTVISTSSGNPIKVPTVDDTSQTAGQHTEGTALTDDGSKDVVFGQKSLDSFGYDTEFVKFSLELARDSIFNMESLLGQLLGERLGRIANTQLTVGDGTGDPNGIVTAASLGVTTAAASAVTYDEIIDLVHSVDPAYRQSPKVRFMFNDLTLAALRKLKDGDGRYIWTMGNVQTGVPGSILGYNYSINQAMASLGAATKSMVFGDFGKYYVRKVGSPLIGVLRERFWPDLGIAGLIYLDGELGDTAAVKHLITHA
ncbi:phage major capsid protein [Bradyrhizobium australafricanum]|uniref:phage major capsid protein n=1 Tax=Bradyrhizobium australafricanum TaxID=2821406 RepID=UPI001CE2C24A|nr:phage major capsid protein [Bradyrhizobium australafricanum]MCA6098858.1 phage major capsid protein [Bradyrhizobium australafricanum]